MMQDSEVIKLVKPVPSDRLATQVLVMWYNTVRPRWCHHRPRRRCL